jgi:hypothetical protein
MRRSIMCLLICVGTGAGCAGTTYGVSATTGYGYGYDPYLAYVSPGVYALTNWDVPVFYSNNLYWRYYNNNWYRSPYYTHGWVRGYPPTAVRGIRQPWAYRYYRPTTGRYYRAPSYYGRDRYDRRYYDRGYDRRYDRRYYPQQRSYQQQRYYRPSTSRPSYTPRTYSTPRPYTPRHYNPGRQYGPRR